MIILDPRTGRNVEIVVPPRSPSTRIEDREAAKRAVLLAKEHARAARYQILRQAELDAGAL